MTTLTTTTTETGFPYEVIHHMRTQICEYRSLREIEVISFKRNKDMSQRVQNAFVRWHRLRTLKSIRKMFLYLNKIKYSIFTYNEMKLWRSISERKRGLTTELQDILQQQKFTGNNEKYINTVVTTIGKYDDNYGLFLMCAMNRVFCNDIARLILIYI
jgi:hypothetical protein